MRTSAFACWIVACAAMFTTTFRRLQALAPICSVCGIEDQAAIKYFWGELTMDSTFGKDSFWIQNEILAPCPICRQPARFKMAIREVSITCSDNCSAPRCVHISPRDSAMCWNGWVCWYRNSGALREELEQWIAKSNALAKNNRNWRRKYQRLKSSMGH